MSSKYKQRTIMRSLISSLIIILLGGMHLACEKQRTRGKAVATVNKRNISMTSFEKALAKLGHYPGKDFSTLGPRKELLKELIDEELLFQKALKDRVFENSDHLRREMAREYLRQKIVLHNYKITDKEIEKEFEKNREDMERIRASHILIKPQKPGDPASEAQAKKKAEKVLAILKIKNTRENFSKLAKQYSEDQGNKHRGGDLSYFHRKTMVPEFSQAAFALKTIGELSEVIKTPYGYHIIRLTGQQRGLDFFRPRIKRQLVQQKQKEAADKLLTKLRSQASVKIFDDALMKAKRTSNSEKRPKAGPHHQRQGN